MIVYLEVTSSILVGEIFFVSVTSVTIAVISFGGVRSYNGFRISRLGVFSVASDSRGIAEIGNVENISFNGSAGTADELVGIPSNVL